MPSHQFFSYNENYKEDDVYYYTYGDVSYIHVEKIYNYLKVYKCL